MRLTIGAVRRNAHGTGATPIRHAWLIDPIRLKRFEDIYPGSPASQMARVPGCGLNPSLPLRAAMRQQGENE